MDYIVIVENGKIIDKSKAVGIGKHRKLLEENRYYRRI